MQAMYSYKFLAPINEIILTEENGFITGLYFHEDVRDMDPYELDNYEKKETPLLKKAFTQLEEYFSGERKTFDLPLNPKGTDFMLKDWDALQTIPYGETCSYKDIAEKIGNPKACRAVGLANNRNPISIVIPCHRVIGANGKLIGYGGGLPIKQYLLELEQKYK